LHRDAVLGANARSSRRLTAVTAALLLVAGVIHLVLTPEHFAEHVLYGVFFLCAAVIQLGLAAALVLHPTLWVFRVGVLSSGGLIATWLVTRAIRPPFSEAAEPVTLAGVLASAVELSALVLLAVALPVRTGRSTGSSPRFSWPWAVFVAPTFVVLFLFASGALARVDIDLSENLAVPSASVDATGGWSFRSPSLLVVLGDHVLLTTSWAVAAFVVLAGALVFLTAGLTVGLARCAACRPQAGGVVAVAPAFLAVPACCGAGLPLGFAFGGGAVAPLLSATPWLLLASILLLSVNLAVLRRRWRTMQAAQPGGERSMPATGPGERARGTGG
jgi:hypothetical protein